MTYANDILKKYPDLSRDIYIYIIEKLSVACKGVIRGTTSALINLSNYYFTYNNDDEAIKYAYQAALEGHCLATYNYCSYLSNKEIDNKKKEEIVQLLVKSSEKVPFFITDTIGKLLSNKELSRYYLSANKKEKALECFYRIKEILDKDNTLPDAKEIRQLNEREIEELEKSLIHGHCRVEDEDIIKIWDKLCEESKIFLNTANDILIMLQKSPQISYDYSVAIMPLFKALECELYKYCFINYVEYMKTKDNINIYDLTEDMRNYTNENCILSFSKRFSLGAAKCIISTYDDYVKPTFLNYIEEKYKVGKKEAFIFFKDYTKDLKKLVDDYRNPSAHRSIITEEKANLCMNEILKIKKMIYKLVNLLNN